MILKFYLNLTCKDLVLTAVEICLSNWALKAVSFPNISSIFKSEMKRRRNEKYRLNMLKTKQKQNS